MNIIQRLLIELVIYLLVYKVEWGDFHVWYHQESCMFGRQGKEHFIVVNSSFGDVFDKNYFVVSIFLSPQRKFEFQSLMKGIYIPVLKIYVLQCGLTVDLYMFFDLFLSFKDDGELRGLRKRYNTTPHVWLWPHPKTIKWWLSSFICI